MKQLSPEEIAAQARIRNQFPLPKKEDRAQIVVRVPESIKQKFDERLQRDGLTCNRLVSAYIMDYITH